MNDANRTALEKVVNVWKFEISIMDNIAWWQIDPAREANWASFPEEISPSILRMLTEKGINRLYSHQAAAWEVIQSGKNAAIVTGTASGKSLCYQLPILNEVQKSTTTTALLLFPTKALAQDQFQSLTGLLAGIENPVRTAVYDGDTPAHLRSQIRKQTQILFTNPDMLHMGILPHHTAWSEFLQNLKYVVVDEMHIYRGVFGSHISNVFRRLKRITRFYGANPQFFFTSATIANPQHLAEKLIEAPVSLISNDGSPRGIRHQLIYNPPIVDERLGIRRSALSESIRLASDLLAYRVQSILFAQSRRSVEIALRNLRSQAGEHSDDIRGYRSGYLPKERREIENELRNGKARVVIATNALELGIDIGGVDAVILIGYPGTIAAARQQAGRAGRKTGSSLGILVASSSPLDQFLVKHPDFLFENTPEQALINPDNLLILLQHLKCAAFELPFRAGDGFGNAPLDTVEGLIQFLESDQILHRSEGALYWTVDRYPSQDVSLRGASGKNVLLCEQNGEGIKTIGEVDLTSASWIVHPGAIYLHEGRSFEVTDLDFEQSRATLRPVEVDYYTDPKKNIAIECLQVHNQLAVKGGHIQYGDVLVTSQLVGYRKINWTTHEIMDEINLELPPSELRTTAYWLQVNQQAVNELRESGNWSNDPNLYGKGWPKIRELVRRRDRNTCQICGAVETERAHHVHHKIPFRDFSDPEQANRFDNLITLCPVCHQRAESVVRMRSGLSGVRYALQHLAPLILMCDINDLGALSDPQSPLADGQPAIILYDQIPAGIGLSDTIFLSHQLLLKQALELVSACGCMDGCPGCVGPAGENGAGGKHEALALLEQLCDG